MHMSRFKVAVVAALIGAAALFLPTTPAHADDWGNNNWTCDYYEICFSGLSNSYWDQGWYVSHAFYYGSMHHGQEVLCDAATPSCMIMMDAVVGFWNRDSTCSVSLWDYDPYSGWYKYGTFPRGFRGDVGAQRNNGHSRC